MNAPRSPKRSKHISRSFIRRLSSYLVSSCFVSTGIVAARLAPAWFLSTTALTVAVADQALGDTTSWDNTTADYLWDTAANWDNGIPTSLVDVTFRQSPSGPTDSPITLTLGESANSLNFRGQYTLTGGTLAITTGQIAVAAGNTSVIDSKLTGVGGLLKSDAGALKLTNAANDYTGTTQIDAGSVIITAQHALGSDSSTVVITGNTTRGSGGGALVIGSDNNNLDGTTFTRDLAVTGGGASGDGAAFNSVGNNTFTGNIVTGGNPEGANPISGTPITASGTRLASTFGTATINGNLTIGPSGQTTEFTGNGNWIINSNIDGAGNLSKTGNGVLILNGNNTFGGTVSVSGGYLRISSQAALGTNTGTGMLTVNAGKVEIRTDAPDFTTATKITQGTSTTASAFYLDRGIGSTAMALNQTVNLGLLTLSASSNTRSLSINGRNGYGVTFTGNMVAGSQGNYTLTNNSNGLLTYAGTFFNTNSTTVRTLTINGNGDTTVTGGIAATGAAHILTKAGNGTLTLRGISTYSGATNIQAGSLAINDFRAVTNNAAAINIGSSTTTATLSIVGNNLASADLSTNKVVNLNGSTGGAIILANQTGTSAGVRFNANFTASGAGAKTLTLGGANAQDNTIFGSIVDSSAATSLLKIDSGTWVLAGANSYTGVTTITNGTLKLAANAPTSTVLLAASTVTFGNNNGNAGGTLEFVGQNGVNNVQTIATLNYAGSGGAETIKLTPGALGTASLVIGNIATGAGGTVNFVGGDFTNNTITISQVNAAPGSDGILTRSVYWNGADFAYRQGGVLRAPVYGVDTGTATSATTLTSSVDNEITGSFATASKSIRTLKFNGGQTLTVNSGQTLTVTGAGLLATGGNSVITGGTLALGSATLVARVDGGADSLRIESVITGTGGVTKSGAGVMVLAGANTVTGTLTIGEGTVRLSGAGTLGGSAALTIRQDATLDLNGVTLVNAVNAFNSNGTVTNGSTTPVTFTIGGANGTGTINGVIEDGVSGIGGMSVSKIGSGSQTWNGASTFTGALNIGSTGKITTSLLADVGQASGIGAGNAASNATNAASLVFSGSTGGIIYNGRNSVSINRLFTLAGTGATIDASGNNNATLIFNNTANIAYGAAGAQELILTGTSTGDNQINIGLVDNGAGALTITKDNTGLWVLGGQANTYSGTTNLVRGTLRAVDGSGLSSNSALLFNSTGTNTTVLESTGSFTRALGTGAGQVSWSSTANGGFAAADSKLTVNLGGAGGLLTWGTDGFVTGNLVLSSTTALAEVEIVNPIDLNGAVRTVQVDINTTSNSDFATLSGVISGGAGSGLTKTGSGALHLIADNTYVGDTTINGGIVRAVKIGDSTSTASNFGAGSGKINLTSGTLAYVGSGETTDREIDLTGTTGGIAVESSGTGALVLTNVKNLSTGTGGRTLSLRGDLNAANEITSALTDGVNGGVLTVTQDDNGTWILSGQSTFTGNMTVSAGQLGIGADSVGAVGTVTSSPVGVTRLIISNGTVFALNGDRTLNTLVRLNGNASSNFVGLNSITLNSIETSTGGNTTVTNMLPAGKLLTINSPTFAFSAGETTARAFVFNGSGDTILNAPVADNVGNVISLIYQGYGSMTLGGSNGGSTYSGATTLSSGTFKLGTNDAIPNGAGKGDVTINPAAGLSATLDLNGFSQTVNGLVASSAGIALIDNSSAAPVTFTVGSQNKAVTLVGGITNSGGGALSLVKTGTAAATFSQGPFTYTGSTTVDAGSLTIATDVTGTTALNVGASALLSFNGGLSASSGITSVQVGAGSELNLINSVGQPLTSLTSLALGAGAILDLNAGATSDTLTLNSGAASVSGAISLNVRDLGSMLGGTTYDLLVAPGGGLLTGGGSAGSYALTGIPGGFTSITLNQSDTVISLTTGTLISDKRYWTGVSGTVWNTVNGTFDGLNWSPDKSGASVSDFIPGAGTTVVFSADNAPGGALVTSLGQGFQINALEFESSAGGATSVTINPGTDSNNRLAIAPADPSDGINLKTGGPATVTIAAQVGVEKAQTWTVADAGSTLKLTGGLSRSGALSTQGAGTIIISAPAGATFAVPTVTINGGTLRTEDVAALGTTNSGNAATVIVNPGGVFYYFGATNTSTTGVNNPITLAGGTLSAGGSTSNHYYVGPVNASADSFINLRDSNSPILTTAQTAIVLTGPLTGTGKLTVDSNSALSSGNPINGTLYFLGDNSGWSGGINLIRGTIQAQSLTGFGTGDVTASAGRLQFNMTANNTVNLSQNFTVDAPGGILELSADAGGTLSGDLTINVNGVVTLGSSTNASNALRITQASDNFSIIRITNSLVLGNNASISYQGSSARPFEISGVISETGGSRDLAINDDLGGWNVTDQTVVLSGANTFTGNITLASGTLQFKTATDAGGAASNLGQGNAISLLGSTLSFIGNTSQSTNRPINTTGSSTLDASGTGGATITYAGTFSQALDNTLNLTGSGEGFINGNITQIGTAADINVNSGTWHLGGAANVLADDIIVTGTSTGTAVMNFETTGGISYNAGSSNGWYMRDGGVINLRANDVNGVANAGGLDFIFVGADATGAAGVFNTNGFNVTVPRLDLGATVAGRTGIITGSGTIIGTYSGTDYAQGFRFFSGSVAANLAGSTTILKQGLDSVTLSGDDSGMTGTVARTRIDSGDLILDYRTSNTTKLPTSVGVDLRGGGLRVVGNDGGPTAETLKDLILTSGGASQIQVTAGSGQTAVLNLGPISRGNAAADGSLRIVLPSGAQTAANGITTTTPNSPAGLLGTGTTSVTSSAYATVDDGTGVWFAKNDGAGNIVAQISEVKNDVTTWGLGDHVTDSAAGYTGTIAAANINSLRFDSSTGSSLQVAEGGILSIASGGILITSNVGNSPKIVGGTLASGATEIVITDDSAATFAISSDIRVNHAITKTGSGTLVLTGNNVYTDETEIQEGTLQVTGNSIGDSSPVNLSAARVSELQLLASETIGRLNGGSSTTGLDGLATVDLGGFTLTLNSGAASGSYAGLIVGSGTLLKNNAGTNTNQAFSGASTGFTGTVIINGGLFQLTGAVGAMNASAYVINKTGSFLIDNNGTTTIGTRILDTATLTLNSADGAFSGETRPSGLSIRHDQNNTQSETVGVITARSGASYARLDSTNTGTSAISTLIASDMVRQNNATFDVRGTNLGDATGRRTQLRIGDSTHETAFIATMVGAGNATGTSQSIVPWAIAEYVSAAGVGDGNMGNSLATYIAGRGFRALDLNTEYATYAGASATDNVRQSLTADLTGLPGKTLNAFVVDNNNTTEVSVGGLGASQTLVNTSGAFLFTVSNGVNATAYKTNLGGFDGGITVGNGEYVIFVQNPSSVANGPALTATISSPLSSAADITKSGRGTLVLTGINTAGGGANKTTLNEGILEISDLDNIGGDTGTLVFAGGTLRLSTAYSGDDLSLRSIFFFAGGATIDTNGVDLTLNHSVGDGLGGLTKVGAGNLTLQSAATYSGPTVISAGTLTIGGSNATGTGGDLTVGAGATLDVGTSSISAGLFSTTGASPAIAGTGTINASNGFSFGNTGDITVGAVLSGAGGLFKNQANILELTGLNTYAGTTEVQAGTLSFNSIGNVGGGASALGAPATVESGILRLGLTTTTATLIYTGIGDSSDRIIALQGTTGSATIDANGTGALILGNVQGEFAGAKALTLGGTSASVINNSLGVIQDGAATISTVKADGNTWEFNHANTYTGATSINEGILRFNIAENMTGPLQFGSANTISTAGTLELNGVDASFGSWVVQTDSATNTSQLIVNAGHSLTINGNVTIGTARSALTNTLVTATGGGALVVNNLSASGVFAVGGTTTAAGVGNKAIADFSGLSSVTINLDPLTGTVRVNPSNGNNTNDRTATLILPATGAGSTTITANKLNVGDSGQYNGSAGQVNQLRLGTGLATLNVNSINIGTGNRDFGSVTFQDPLNGSITVRAADGIGAADFNMGTTGGATGVATATGVQNTFDVTGHAADLLFHAVTIGTQSTRGDVLTNVFSFDTGTLVMDTLTASVKTGTPSAGAHVVDSTINIGGGAVTIGTISQFGQASTSGNIANAVLNVTGGNVNIGTGTGTAITTASAGSAATATAVLHFSGGVTTVNGDIVRGGGAGTASTTVILDGGSLDMTGHSLGSGSSSVAATFASGALANLAEFNGGANVIKTTAGLLTVNGVNAYTGETHVDEGTLIVSGSLSGTVAVNVAAGATLGGSGTLNPAATLTVLGTLSPGTSPGTLNTGNVVMQAGSHFALDLGATVPGSGYDVLNVTGTVSLDGDLQVTLFPGFADNVGDRFFVILNDGIDPVAGGKFTNVDSSGNFTTGDGRVFFVNYQDNAPTGSGLGNDVSLTLMSVPEPEAISALLGGIGMLLGLSRIRRGRR